MDGDNTENKELFTLSCQLEVPSVTQSQQS